MDYLGVNLPPSQSTSHIQQIYFLLLTFLLWSIGDRPRLSPLQKIFEVEGGSRGPFMMIEWVAIVHCPLLPSNSYYCFLYPQNLGGGRVPEEQAGDLVLRSNHATLDFEHSVWQLKSFGLAKGSHGFWECGSDTWIIILLERLRSCAWVDLFILCVLNVSRGRKRRENLF